MHWFRRDLRIHDNTALDQALSRHTNVLPLFIFDTQILHDLRDKTDARVTFIYDALANLHRRLQQQGSGILIRIGKPGDVWRELLSAYQIDAVYTNSDYEPYARDRDAGIGALLKENNIPLHSYKDHVIFEKNEVVKDDGKPYTVFTPYSKKWKLKFSDIRLQSPHAGKNKNNYHQVSGLRFPEIEEIGFKRSSLPFPSPVVKEEIIKTYHHTRDFPSLEGTSRLSVHLRFGTISIRDVVAAATHLNEKFLNELIWREFYQMILWHFPEVIHHAFKKDYDRIPWRNNEKEFMAWCAGNTGYSIVDAGMRELNTTGYMHNRVRMIVASFLTKHLLTDWRRGEAYFAEKLLDFELASNNGGWQWAAGSGVDAAPYFRIFNPHAQTKKFDPELKYIRKWVPEIDSLQYPQPIVEHAFARQRCLDTYKSALRSSW